MSHAMITKTSFLERHPLSFISRSHPILEQLQLEEALFRADQRNWCLLNSGSPPAIVMGISGLPER